MNCCAAPGPGVSAECYFCRSDGLVEIHVTEISHDDKGGHQHGERVVLGLYRDVVGDESCDHVVKFWEPCDYDRTQFRIVTRRLHEIHKACSREEG